jgi:hypothetical protein
MPKWMHAEVDTKIDAEVGLVCRQIRMGFLEGLLRTTKEVMQSTGSGRLRSTWYYASKVLTRLVMAGFSTNGQLVRQIHHEIVFAPLISYRFDYGRSSPL